MSSTDDVAAAAAAAETAPAPTDDVAAAAETAAVNIPASPAKPDSVRREDTTVPARSRRKPWAGGIFGKRFPCPCLTGGGEEEDTSPEFKEIPFEIAFYDGGVEAPAFPPSAMLEEGGVHCSASGSGQELSLLLRRTEAAEGLAVGAVVISGADACTNPVRAGLVWAFADLSNPRRFFEDMASHVGYPPEASGEGPDPLATFEAAEWGGAAVVVVPEEHSNAEWIAVRFLRSWGDGSSLDIGRVAVLSGPPSKQFMSKRYAPPPGLWTGAMGVGRDAGRAEAKQIAGGPQSSLGWSRHLFRERREGPDTLTL